MIFEHYERIGIYDTPESMDEQKATTRWPNGRIRSIAIRVDGKKHGRQQAWHESDQPSYDHNYLRGERHGRQQGWYESGQPEYDWNHERDKQHGRQRYWCPNGQPYYDRAYEHGRWHGSVRDWDIKGNLVSDAWYEHGVAWDREPAQQRLKGQEDVMIMALITLAASYI